MVNGAFNDITASRDFGLEQRDPRLELRHREWIEILARKLGGGVVGSAGKIVFHRLKVGRSGGDVKRSGRLLTGLRNCGLDVAGCGPDSGGVLGESA